jgi:signal transduction histidine kinase
VSKNLERASQLVRTFKQLSAHELADARISCDLGAIISDCIEEVQPEIARRRITVRTAYRPEGADFPWLGFQRSMCNAIGQLFQNVLRHAYEEGHEGACVDIRLIKGRAARAGDGYRLEFQDYGVGLSPEILARMFEPFVTPRREKGGMGLGLAIVRNIVTNLLGGTIRCTSAPGQGTHFVIILPRAVPVDKTE